MLPTSLTRVPLLPEIELHLAAAGTRLFDAFGGEFRSDVPPPFWAFAWAGGQALARYVLDRPEIVRGRRVIDIATGSGVAAVAAAVAGASVVHAQDVDPAALRAAERNAAANGVVVRTGEPAEPADVVLAGDVFYSTSVARTMSDLLRAEARRGALVLVGDPGRGYFPERLFTRAASFEVPVPAVLEEASTLVTGVWEMRATAPGKKLRSSTN